MPLDFTKPVVTGAYATDILPPIVQAQIALAQMLDPAVAGTLTGTPTGAYRINGTAFERYNGTTWGTYTLNIAGNAATATLATSATSATTSTHLAGGAAGVIPYQTAAGATAMLAAGTSGQVLRSNGAAPPSWVSQSALAVGSATTATSATSATTATTATNVAAGAVGEILYQSAAGTTAKLAPGAARRLLVSGGTGAAPAYSDVYVDAVGRLYGTALHNNATLPTGASNQFIASGTYTPTLTASTGVLSSAPTPSADRFVWTRVGNVVTVAGSIGFTVFNAAVNGLWRIKVSLPIASAFVSGSACWGIAQTRNYPTPVDVGGVIIADIVNDAADVSAVTATDGARQVVVQFSYEVV
jgi:hypothetical protein